MKVISALLFPLSFFAITAMANDDSLVNSSGSLRGSNLNLIQAPPTANQLQNRELLVCDLLEVASAMAKEAFDEYMDKNFDGYTHRISRRKRLIIHEVQEIDVDGCTVKAKLGVTLWRKWRRDGKGHIYVQGQVDPGNLVAGALGQLPDIRIPDRIQDVIPDRICFDNIKVTDIRLSSTTRITENIYKVVANKFMPDSFCIDT